MEVKEIIETIENDLEWHSKELKPKYKKALIMAIMLLKKEIPKEPAYQGEHEKCPSCGSFYIEDYCAMCGQKIDRD